jgi:hypothetical protein
VNFKTSIIALCALSTLTACTDVTDLISPKSKKSKSNFVSNKSSHVNQVIGDDEIELQVLSESSLKEAAINKSLLTLADARVQQVLASLPQGTEAESISTEQVKTAEESLMVGFPIGLVGEQNIFGGVITKVTDRVNETLGTLKLTDLPPIHVRTVISGLDDGAPALTLVGCFEKCEESSEQQGLLSLPILGFNPESNMLIVDMSAIGKELDLMSMLDPQGEYTKLKSISSDTTAVDYDMKTLIFDIKSRMIPVGADASNPNTPVTEFTVRWYLKLNSDSTQGFVSRAPTPEVGFFQTERSASSKITRFSTAPKNGPGQPTVQYFIKNVPEEFKGIFAKAMDSWNVEFKKIIGRDLLSYEFIDASDERAEQLVPGDIRFNIIEWDLVNKAGYGGLGPSIANQFTGETMSANVLIQGPTIVKLYKEWFGVSQKMNELKEAGKIAEANKLLKDFNVQVSRDLNSRAQQKFALKLGKNLQMNIPAQRPELEDPIVKGEFEVVPAGMTYEKYMEGYMLEILAHEVGHNLGLRHNFKGNLGSYESNEPGSVSRSVMEYLGRPYRHKNTIGPYDRMALAYGYKGSAPEHKDWFCTDEDQGFDAKTLAVKSPECSKADATNDPFSYWENRFNRILELLVETKSNAAPIWKAEEIKAQIEEATTGLAAYALSAEATAHTWTNFFGKNDRPENKAEMKNYVLERFKKKLCNPEIEELLDAKETVEAHMAATVNLTDLRDLVAKKTSSLGLYTVEQLSCN